MDETELQSARLDAKQHVMRGTALRGRLQCLGSLCEVGSGHLGEAGGFPLHVLKARHNQLKAGSLLRRCCPLPEDQVHLCDAVSGCPSQFHIHF